MDTIERDFQYDQIMDDIKVQMELFILEAFTSVLDQLMDSYKKMEGNAQDEEVNYPF